MSSTWTDLLKPSLLFLFSVDSIPKGFLDHYFIAQILICVPTAPDKRVSTLYFFLFLHKNICCGYSLEMPQWGISNEYPQQTFLWRKEKYQHFSDDTLPYRPRWLSWMHRPTGDQEVAGSTPAEVGNILSWRLIMKYFLRSFSPFRWFKKGSCQFLAKECAQYWLTV